MKKIGSFIFLFFFPFMVFAQDYNVSLELSQEEVGLGDFFELSIVVKADKNAQISEPQIPNFADFTKQGSRSEVSDQVSIINGEYKFVRNYRYSYTLVAEHKGTFDIPPISVSINDKTHRTSGAKIRVVDPGSVSNAMKNRPQGPTFQDPFEEMEERFRSLLQRQPARPTLVKPINPDEAFSLRLQVDKEQAYIGEQITASYYLYVPSDVMLRSIDTLKFPSLSQFWKEDIEISTKLNFEPVEINGKSFMRALLASYALFPIKHGKVKIDAYKVKCSVASRSAFGFGKTYTYTKSSDEVTVDVLPLPDANRPANFGGAVGDFNITSSIEERHFEQGQPFTMKIKIEGKGNAKVIELPEIAFPATIDFYDSKEEARFFTNGQSFKEFTLYLTPLEAGEVDIPAVNLIYFDPAKMQYVTKTTSPKKIQVQKGKLSNIKDSRLDIDEKAVAKADLPKVFTTLAAKEVSVADRWLYLAVLAIFAGGFIYLLFIAKRDLWTSSEKKIFLKKIELRKEKLKRYSQSKDVKDFAIEGLNFLYFLLGENLRSGHSSEKLSRNLENLPTSLREKVGGDVMDIASRLQAIAFAPEEMTKALREEKSKDKVYKDILQVASDLIDYHLQSFVD